MKFNTYQQETRRTAMYPDDEAIRYLALGLAGESGEVAEKVKKWRREDDTSYLDALQDELGDVLWYLARLADELDIELEEVATGNLDKLLDRKERGKITGSGDDR